MEPIQKILEQLKNSLISEQDAINQLEYLFISQEGNQTKKPKIETLTRPLSPEEILIEEETIQERKEFVKLLASQLSPHYKRILWMYAIQQMTMQQIGDKLGISKQAVSIYIKRINERAKKIGDRTIIYKPDNQIDIKKR